MTTGRFAPSPTGNLHLGNLRTALVAWWWARHDGGRFVLRIDDLDPATARPRYEAAQLADLAAVGIDWDRTPMRQSEQTDRYRDALADLERAGLLYPCFCTRREIAEAASAPNRPHGHDGYPGTCRHLSRAEVDQRRSEGRRPALRVRGEAVRVDFVDEVHGLSTGVVDDAVVRRNDGVAAYHLAVVLDDAEQGVDLVVRGDDLLDSTPRQIHLAGLLGIDHPRYAHVPLVLALPPAADGSVVPEPRRLAKRDGAVTLADRIELGDRVDDVVAWLAATFDLESTAPSALLAAAYVDGFTPQSLRRPPLVVTSEFLSEPLPGASQR